MTRAAILRGITLEPYPRDVATQKVSWRSLRLGTVYRRERGTWSYTFETGRRERLVADQRSGTYLDPRGAAVALVRHHLRAVDKLTTGQAELRLGGRAA